MDMIDDDISGRSATLSKMAQKLRWSDTLGGGSSLSPLMRATSDTKEGQAASTIIKIVMQITIEWQIIHFVFEE